MTDGFVNSQRDGRIAMNSRQRVMAAVARREVDRVPARFNGWGENSMKIARHLGLDVNRPDWEIVMYERLGIDMVNGSPWTPPGVEPPDLGPATAPWKDAASVADLNPAWAEFLANPANVSFQHMVEWMRERDQRGNPPALLIKAGMMFGTMRSLRGCEQAMMDLADGNDILNYILDATEQQNVVRLDKAHADLGDRIDLFYFVEELGMQDGLMYPPGMIREHFFPRLKRLFARAHGYGYKVFFHSCGAIRELIPDLIELGVDVLNPIQPGGQGMAPEELARDFGGKVCFCGGMDMQRLMPMGKPDEVRKEAERYMRVLAPGYILDYANILHEDIPPENSLAMYAADRKCGG